MAYLVNACSVPGCVLGVCDIVFKHQWSLFTRNSQICHTMLMSNGSKSLMTNKVLTYNNPTTPTPHSKV